MCATMIKQKTYEIITNHCEMSRGSQVTVSRQPIKNGDLAVIRSGKILVVGRYFADVAGHDWIIQPGRLIRVNVPVRLLSLVEGRSAQ